MLKDDNSLLDVKKKLYLCTLNRLGKRSGNFLRAGEREENYKTCAVRTLPFTYVNVDSSAK